MTGFCAGAFVWLCTVVLLWVVGWAMARFLPPPEADPGAIALFVSWAREFVAPEPDERRIYIVLTLLSPLLILTGWMLLHRRSLRGGKESGREPRGWKSFPVAAVPAVALLVGLCGVTAYLWRNAPIVNQVLTLSTPDLPWIAAGTGMLWLVLVRRVRRRPAKVWTALALAGSVALALIGGAALRVFDYRTAGFAGAVHLNTVLYPIVQVANGQRTLVDFLPQYGCYAEMLRPFLWLSGVSVFRITLWLAAAQCLAFGAVLWTFFRLLRSRWLLVLGAAALAWLPMWVDATMDRFDPYFQYYPLRVLFPALSLPAAWLCLRRPTLHRAVAAGALGGLAVWWNIDSGVVTLVSLLGLLAGQALIQRRRPLAAGERRAGPLFLAGCAAALLALGGFYLWLCLEARTWIDVGSALRYQSIFYGSGFYMLRMPAALDPWHLVIAVYLLGLTLGLGRAWNRRSLGVGEGMASYLGVLGIGLFSYYQGRSHPIVLMLCCWPAVWLALLLGDRLLTAARYRLLPRWCAAGALPVLVLTACCAASLWHARGYIVKTDRMRWQGIPAGQPTSPVPRQVGYLKRTLPPGESCAIISPYQSIYYAATGLRSGLTGQSIFECLLQSDLEHLFGQLRERRVQHLFTEAADYPPHQGNPLGPEFLAVVTDFYRLAGLSEDGLMHWVPRTDEERQADPGGSFSREFSRHARLNASPPAVRHALRLPPSHLLFDQNCVCVSLPYDWGRLTPGNDWAFEILLTPEVPQHFAATVISNHPGKQYEGLTLQQSDSQEDANVFRMFFGTGHEFIQSEAFPLAPGREHYVAATCANHRVSIFVDGQALPPVELKEAIASSEMPLMTGNWISGDRPFHGEITEVKWHDHALPPEVIVRTEAELTAPK